MSTTPPTPPRSVWRRRRGCLLRTLLALLLVGGAGGLTVRIFGDGIVPPLVDAVRGLVGPTAMAEIEAHYYDWMETTHQWQRDLGLAPPVTAPWAAPSPPAALPLPQATAGLPASRTAMAQALPSTVPAVVPGDAPALPPPPAVAATPTAAAGRGPRATPFAVQAAGSPVPLTPLIKDAALAGEGQWSSAGLPLPPNGGPPVFWKAFIRPDAARPDVLVYLVRIDPRRVGLHLVAGRTEPVSPLMVHGSGQVAPADRPNLAVAFNGGFKTVNGHYGMMVGRQLIAPPNPAGDTATLAVHADGRIEIGPWQTLGTAADMVSYRQNCPLMIAHGAIVVQDHNSSAWGLSVLNAMYVWRSGLGMTQDGALIYAAGNRLSATELAVALQQAGAVYAMQLDINSAWVHWLNYRPDGAGKLHPTPLVSGMAYRQDQYLTPGDRDFFYFTWP